MGGGVTSNGAEAEAGAYIYVDTRKKILTNKDNVWYTVEAISSIANAKDKDA